jgi:hypothetical protein
VSDPTTLPTPPRRGPDLTINLGHILIIGFTACGLIGSHYVNDYRLTALERQGARIEAKLDGFNATVIEAAILKSKVEQLERRMTERR